MALVRLYVQHQKVILPTVAETEAGFYIETAPVKVFEIGEVDDWKSALYVALKAGNQVVATPERAEEPGSAILEKLKIDKWSTFETAAVMYTVQSGGRYIYLYRTGKTSSGMWTNEGREPRLFAAKTPIDYVIDAIVEDVLQQPEANRPKTALMVMPPKGD